MKKRRTREDMGDVAYEALLARNRQYKKTNRHMVNACQRANRQRLKMDALRAYGGPSPVCYCCGEANPGFLTLDHLWGDGAPHRRERKGEELYCWLARNDYPTDLGLAVACFNCNIGRELNGGECPHHDRRDRAAEFLSLKRRAAWRKANAAGR